MLHDLEPGGEARMSMWEPKFKRNSLCLQTMVEAQRLVFNRRRKLGYKYDFCLWVVWEMERLVIVGCGSSTILKAEDTGPLEVTSRLGAGRFGEVFAAACRHQPHFALKAILKQPMADFEPETKAPKQLRGAEKNYATSWSSGIQRRTRFAVGALLGQKLASRVFEEPASVLLVWELMFGLRHTHALTHHPLGHYAWEPLPHRHWQGWRLVVLAAAKWGMDSNTKQEVHVTTLQRWSRRGSDLASMVSPLLSRLPFRQFATAIDPGGHALPACCTWKSFAGGPMSCLFVRLWGAGAPDTVGDCSAKRLAGGNDKARQGLRCRTPSPHGSANQPPDTGKEFPLFAAFVFPLIEDDCEHTPSPISHSCW